MIFILEILVGLTVVIADDDDDDINEEEEETEAEMDCYVRREAPFTNYGGSNYLNVDNYIFTECSFLYFDFDDEPDDWEDVEISLYFFGVSNTMDLDLYLIPVDLSEFELTLNWDNSPKAGIFISKTIISNKGNYKLDVSDLVEDLLDDDEEGFTICLNTSDSGYLWMYSKEGAYDSDDAPQLIWTYELIPELEFEYNLILTIIFLIVVPSVIISVILLVLYFTEWRKKEPKKPKVPKSVVQPPHPPPPAQPSISQAQPDILAKFCPSCGEKITLETYYCTHCGANLND